MENAKDDVFSEVTDNVGSRRGESLHSCLGQDYIEQARPGNKIVDAIIDNSVDNFGHPVQAASRIPPALFAMAKKTTFCTDAGRIEAKALL
jgi:hypothetical protein